MLDSDDPAVRMLGIRALEKLTSRTLGYEYWAPEWKRRQAVDRWVVWYEAEGHLLAAEDQADPQPSP